MGKTAAVQVLVTINGKTVTVENNKKNVVSLKVNRVIGDVANKFTLELFDETAWKLESALYKTGSTPISIQYGATGEWASGKYCTFSGLCTNYNLSFVGAATMLSIEGVIYNTAGIEGSNTASYWFKNDTIQWVSTEIKTPSEEDLVSLYGKTEGESAYAQGYNSAKFRKNCSIDGRGVQSTNNSGVIIHGFEYIDSATGDYYDDICARIEWIPPERNDGVNWYYRPIINPTNIFKRIIRKYNGEIGNNNATESQTLGNTMAKDADVKIMGSITSSTVDTIKKGTKIKIIEEIGTYVRIEYGDNKKGYVRRSTITVKKTAVGSTSGTGKFQIDPKNVDDTLWIDASGYGGVLGQTACTAADFIVNTLCKIAVKPKSKSAGFHYFLKNGKHCFKAIDYSKVDTAKSVKAGYYVKDSNVISFSVNQVGAMVMAGAETDPETKEVLVDVASVDLLTGEIITSEGYFAEGNYISEEKMNTKDKSNSIEWNNRKVSSAKVVSSGTKSLLDITWSDVFDKISDFTISASLTLWGEYNNTYIPGNYIDVTVMTPDGHKHYSSGNYFIISADDNVTSDGYTTTLKLLKGTDKSKKTFNSDFTAEKVKPGSFAYGVNPYEDTTTTTVSIAGQATNYNAPQYVYTQQTHFDINDYKKFLSGTKLSKAKQQFVVDMGALARKYWEPFHIYPSSLLAQAICESAWGTSNFATKRNNFFGIAAFDSNPGAAYSFGSMEECVVAYFLRTYWSSTGGGSSKMGEYYNYKDVISATNYSKQVKAIGYCGYASSTSYYKTLNSLINTYDLYKWNDGLPEFKPDTSKKGKYKWKDFWPPKS